MDADWTDCVGDRRCVIASSARAVTRVRVLLSLFARAGRGWSSGRRRLPAHPCAVLHPPLSLLSCIPSACPTAQHRVRCWSPSVPSVHSARNASASTSGSSWCPVGECPPAARSPVSDCPPGNRPGGTSSCLVSIPRCRRSCPRSCCPPRSQSVDSPQIARATLRRACP